ncbi:hypothetical protein BLNAU_23345 [Blattamonas nauphoetae]|uniref:Uncharacterized protein n=1 Tax=Blattamonas nauphoetae TaxID=2049346 RepID=A0ABQ9WQI7_9EUKA|nr:hypothetical protein BLNAU_23345 [Blattamonas nauphoetae]
MKRCSAVISNETSINHQSEIRRTHSPLVLVRGNAKAGREGGALHVICSSSIGPSAQTTYAIFEDCESGSGKGITHPTTFLQDKGLWMFVSLIPLNKMESVHFRNGMLNKISNGIHPNYLDLGMMSNKEVSLPYLPVVRLDEQVRLGRGTISVFEGGIAVSFGKISQNTVSFSGCSCDDANAGSVIHITRPFFMENQIVLEGVTITSPSSTHKYQVFISCPSAAAHVKASWSSFVPPVPTIPLQLHSNFWCEDSADTSKSSCMAYHVYPFTSGTVHVSDGCEDHVLCGSGRAVCVDLGWNESVEGDEDSNAEESVCFDCCADLTRLGVDSQSSF